MARELTEYVDAVLSLVESVPEGCVTTYGDLAAMVGSKGPRAVGRVMSTYGGAVPWWRVVRADGRPAQGHEREALRRLATEGVRLRGGPPPDRVDLTSCRWDGGGCRTPVLG